jgi:osmoprotectant transport system ATP-binding protein
VDAEGRAAGVVSQAAIGEAIRGAHAAGREERPTTAETAQKVIR